MITLWRTSDGFAWMPDRRCTMCGDEDPAQLERCVEEKNRELEEFLEKGGTLTRVR